MIKKYISTLAFAIVAVSAHAQPLTESGAKEPVTVSLSDMKKKIASLPSYRIYCVGYNPSNGFWRLFFSSGGGAPSYTNTGFPTAQYLADVAASSAAARTDCIMTAFESETPAQLIGGTLYLGYGLSLDEMVASGRYSAIFNITQ